MNQDVRDPFLVGNEIIEEAISTFHADQSDENLITVLESIRARMHADGHFVIPVVTHTGDEMTYSFRGINTNDGNVWNVVFTSQKEFEKGQPSQVISHFIDAALKACVEASEAKGFIVNPWSDDAFMLSRELIQIILDADDGVEYSVPEDPITKELLEDGSFLTRAVEICCRNDTDLNALKLMKILRSSNVWVPCVAIPEESGNDTLTLFPDILQDEDKFYLPVFSTAEEMGEYGENFAKIERNFMDTIKLARNNEKDLSGIVINAFTNEYIIDNDMLNIIEGMQDIGSDSMLSQNYFKIGPENSGPVLLLWID